MSVYYGGNAIRSGATVPMPYPNYRLTQPITYTALTFPTELAVPLDYVKEHIRVTDTSEDSYITSLIKTAMQMFESYTGRILINTQFETFRSFFSNSIELRRSKLQTLDIFGPGRRSAYSIARSTRPSHNSTHSSLRGRSVPPSTLPGKRASRWTGMPSMA